MTVAILQKSARESRKLPVAIQNGKIATGFKKCHGKKKTLKGLGTERARLGTFRGLGTERARLGTFRGFGTERARLGTFRGLGTERARLGTLKKNSNFLKFSLKMSTYLLRGFF